MADALTNRRLGVPLPRVERLIPGASDPIVLLDFAFATEGVLRAALGQACDGHQVVRLDPVSHLADATVIPAIPELASAYVAALLEGHGRPVVLAGFCGTARLTVEIAAQLAQETSWRPHTVLVEPDWMDNGSVRANLAEARANLGCPDPGDLAGVPMDLRSMLSLLAKDIEARLSSDGVPEDEIADARDLLLERFRGFFGFQLATLRFTIRRGWESWTTSCDRSSARELILRLATGERHYGR